MMISTRGRYALRVLIDMAEHSDTGFIPMKEIAERQEISKKYMEQIMPVLVKNGLVEGVHGAGGGYRLTRTPEQYTVGEILRLTEGTLPRRVSFPVTRYRAVTVPTARTIDM